MGTLYTPFGKDNPPPNRKGTRNTITKAFLKALAAEFDATGANALARLSFSDPGKFLELVSKLVPQKLEVTTVTEDISDDRLEELIAAAERMTIEGSAQLLSCEPHPAQPLTLAHNIGIEPLSLAHDARLGSEPLPLNHEKPQSALAAKEGGGGPDARNVPSPENRSSTTPERPRTGSAEKGDPAIPAIPATEPPHRKRGRPRKGDNPLNSIAAMPQATAPTPLAEEPIDPDSLF